MGIAATKLTSYADFERFNFFRLPDWRWNRVLELLTPKNSRPRRCTKRDDEYVRDARAFVLKWQNGDKATRNKLKWECPGLFFAYDFNQRLLDAPNAGMFLQARLLAGQTPAEVGAVLGMMPEAVEWYSVLFFDVCPYLKQRDWITNQVLLPALMRSDQAKDDAAFKDSTVARPILDGTIKLFAYFGGPYVVDMLVAGVEAGKPLVSADEAHGWLDKTIAGTLRVRSLQASRTFEVNKYNVMELFATHARIMELDRSAENQDQARTTIENHIRAMVNDIPWGVGADGADMAEGTVVGRFDRMSAELRDDELLQIASGRVAPTIQDAFPAALPPPRRENKAILTTTDVTLP